MISLHSIHARILFSASLLLFIFLGLSGVALLKIYQNDAEHSLKQELKTNSYALLAAAKESEKGEMRLPKTVSNPQLNRPSSPILASVIGENKTYLWLSGSHQNQQISINHYKQQLLQLKETTIGQYHYSVISNSSIDYSQLVLTISWDNFENEELKYSIVIQISRQNIQQQINQFKTKLWLWLGGTGFLLVIIQGLVLNWGLHPLRQASQEVNQIQTGNIQRLSTNYPKELSGLAFNINNLINYSNIQLERYRNGLGDLSHSLKTPLAIIQGVLDTPDKKQTTNKNNSDINRQIQEQVQFINDKVHYHLQRAAIAGNKPLAGKISVHNTIEKLINALQKVYFEKNVIVSNDEENRSAFFHGEESDLMELMGNLLDNAFKYCFSNIRIQLKPHSSQQIKIAITNDGKLIDEESLQLLMQRGIRADQKHEGQGIGLHIVSEIVYLYQGDINITNTSSKTAANNKNLERNEVLVQLIIPGEISG